MASTVLNHLQISTPTVAIVQVSTQFLTDNPDVKLRLGSRLVDVEPGYHFGSRYPGDPAKVRLYDFVPDVLLAKVLNRSEFLGVLAFDKWIGNADSRQAVFFRARHARELSASTTPPGLYATMIDQGYAFGGPQWCYYDSPIQGLYFRDAVYSSVTTLDDFQPWLDRIVNFPEKIVQDARNQIPPDWLERDEPALEALLAKLMSRRRRVPELLADCRNARRNPFPDWRPPGH